MTAGISSTTFAPFIPISIPGCAVWLRADLGITISTGVSQWNDQSGNGNNVISAIGAQQPAYNKSDNTLNGMPSISSVAASSQFLSNTSFTLASPYTIFLVGYCAVGQDAAISGSSAEFPYFGVGQTTNAFIGGPTAQIAIGGLTVTNASMAAGVVFSSTSATVYGNNINNFTSGNVGSIPFSGLYVFEITDVVFETSTIAEIIIYSSALQTASIESVFNYLGARYKIATT